MLWQWSQIRCPPALIVLPRATTGLAITLQMGKLRVFSRILPVITPTPRRPALYPYPSVLAL